MAGFCTEERLLCSAHHWYPGDHICREGGGVGVCSEQIRMLPPRFQASFLMRRPRISSPSISRCAGEAPPLQQRRRSSCENPAELKRPITWGKSKAAGLPSLTVTQLEDGAPPPSPQHPPPALCCALTGAQGGIISKKFTAAR